MQSAGVGVRVIMPSRPTYVSMSGPTQVVAPLPDPLGVPGVHRLLPRLETDRRAREADGTLPKELQALPGVLPLVQGRSALSSLLHR